MLNNMVASFVLDLTLDVGMWLVGKVGKGIVSLVSYAFTTQDPDHLAICSSEHSMAQSLDAAATLRTDGVLDDFEYVRIVSGLVNPKKRDTPTPTAPEGPPAYEAISSSKLNLETNR